MNRIRNILPPICIFLAISGCEQALDAHANAEEAYNARMSKILGVAPVDAPPEPFELSGLSDLPASTSTVPVAGIGPDPVRQKMAAQSWIHSGVGPVEYEMAKQSWIHSGMDPVQYQMCQDSWIHC